MGSSALVLVLQMFVKPDKVEGPAQFS